MEYPIRVLHVVVNMNRGGAETLIMNLYRNIDRDKLQFDFLVHKDDGVFEEEILSLGGHIYRIPYVTAVGHFSYSRELDNFFREHSDYKIVHAHMDCMSGLVLEAAKNNRIPIRISHSHNTQSEGKLLARIYKDYIKKKIIPNATDLMACSEKAADWLFGEKAQSSLTLKNGIEPDRFTFNEAYRKIVREKLGIGDEFLLVGHIGRFCPQKNHKLLIDIFSELSNKNKNVKLILIGDGPLRRDIEKRVARLKLEESVVFLGSRNDVPELLQAMDILLFPSLHEGLPLTIIEAQAAGLKCVVSEAVPKNADVDAGLVTFINLKADFNKWIKEIEKPYKREKRADIYLRKCGYDIANTAKELQNSYIKSIDKYA